MLPKALIVVILFGFYNLTNCHPQCLDFRPPFESKKVKFCVQYKTFGCCSKIEDDEIKSKYNIIMSRITKTKSETCGSYLKDLLCQVCSPYAAHIYSAEQTLAPTSFPGLCPDYCIQFHSKCKDIVPFITGDHQLLTSLNSVNTFCLLVKLTDEDYCYPDILENQNLNFKISTTRITSKDCLCLEEFAWNLRSPLLARHAGDGSGRLFVAEQRGVIYVYYKNKTRERRAFLDIKDRVLHTRYIADERGFLGLTFHPHFARNQRFFVYYSARLPDRKGECIRISEFRVFRKNRNRANRNSERVILEVEQPYANHNGGEILFGDDGYLYIFVGDGGSGGDPHGNSQNKSVLLGKVLRIDVDRSPGDQNYTIPPDNPFINESNSRPEIYALGIRNIWRCDKDEGDRVTGENKGRIICGDVGQNAYEEIDIIYKGANYGWNGREGYQCYNPKFCGKVVPEELPIFSYPHAIGKSITGGHVYRGCQNPNLEGLYIYGDFTNGRLFRLHQNKTTQMWVNKELFMCKDDVCLNGQVGRYEPYILSFGEDEDGEIYMLTTAMPSASARAGKVYKIVDPLRRGDPDLCEPRIFANSTHGRHGEVLNTTGEWRPDVYGYDDYLDDMGSGECLDPSGYVCTADQYPPGYSDSESGSGSGFGSGSGSGSGDESTSDELDREYNGKNETSGSKDTDIYIEPPEPGNGTILPEGSRTENKSGSTDLSNHISPVPEKENANTDNTSKTEQTTSVNKTNSEHMQGEIPGSGDPDNVESTSGSGYTSGNGELSGSGDGLGEGSGRENIASSAKSVSSSEADFYVVDSGSRQGTTAQPKTTKKSQIILRLSSSPKPETTKRDHIVLRLSSSPKPETTEKDHNVHKFSSTPKPDNNKKEHIVLKLSSSPKPDIIKSSPKPETSKKDKIILKLSSSPKPEIKKSSPKPETTKKDHNVHKQRSTPKPETTKKNPIILKLSSSPKPETTKKDHNVHILSSTSKPEITTKGQIILKLSSSPQPQLVSVTESDDDQETDQSSDDLSSGCSSGDCLDQSGDGCSSGSGCSNLDITTASPRALNDNRYNLDTDDVYIAEYLGITKVHQS